MGFWTQSPDSNVSCRPPIRTTTVFLAARETRRRSSGWPPSRRSEARSRDDELLWGDELEYAIIKVDDDRARLCLRGGQFFAGNCLSWADIMLVVLQDNLCSEVVGEAACLAKYPRLCSLYERVCCLPNIKAWRGTRPVDPMFKN